MKIKDFVNKLYDNKDAFKGAVMIIINGSFATNVKELFSDIRNIDSIQKFVADNDDIIYKVKTL